MVPFPEHDSHFIDKCARALALLFSSLLNLLTVFIHCRSEKYVKAIQALEPRKRVAAMTS